MQACSVLHVALVLVGVRRVTVVIVHIGHEEVVVVIQFCVAIFVVIFLCQEMYSLQIKFHSVFSNGGEASRRVFVVREETKAAGRGPALQTPPKFHEKTPKERKRANMGEREGKKARNFGQVQSVGLDNKMLLGAALSVADHALSGEARWEDPMRESAWTTVPRTSGRVR